MAAIQTINSAAITQGFPLYNVYADIFLTPDRRKEVVQRGNMPNFLMYLYDQRLNLLGAGHREVTTRKYFWEEVMSNKLSYNFTIAAGSSLTGSTVTATVASPTTAAGYAIPDVGMTAFTNVAGQIVQFNVASSDKTTKVVTLVAANGGTPDLSAKAYTFQFDPNITYVKACSGTIAKNGYAQTAPNIGTGVIQEYENGKTICQDALSHYAHDNVPTKFQMRDSITGEFVDTYCLAPAVQQQVLNDMMYGQFLQMMVGTYNQVTDSGTDGLLTSVARRGGYSFNMNGNNVNQIIASLTIQAKRYIREGINSATLWCDQEMYSNLNKAVARILGSNNFANPIWSTSSNTDYLNWYGFGGIKNFLGLGFDFKFARFTGWEQMNYDVSIMRNFAVCIPDMNFTSSLTGEKIPNMEIVKLKGCDGMQIAKQNGTGASLWYDDTRIRGGRTLDIYSRNQFGFDIHGLPYYGLISGNCQSFQP